jgi:hypothetical protein
MKGIGAYLGESQADRKLHENGIHVFQACRRDFSSLFTGFSAAHIIQW